MAKITVTFTITEFCLHTGLSEEELNEIVGLGMIERAISERRHRPMFIVDLAVPRDVEPDVDTRDLERSQPEYGRQQHI